MSKVFIVKKKATAIKLDPRRETADIDEKNNVWPKGEWKEASKFSLFKAGAGNRRNPGGSGKNPMQAANEKNAGSK